MNPDRRTSSEPDVGLDLQGLKTIVQGSGIAFVGRVGVMLLNVLLQWMLARAFGSVVVGNLSLGLTVVSLASVVVLFGLHRGVLRYVAHYAGLDDQERMAGALITALRIYAVTALVITIAILLGSGFLAETVFGKPELERIFLILALSVPCLALSTILSSYLQALKRIHDKVIIELLEPLLNILGIGFVLYVASVPERGAPYVLAGSSILTALLAVVLVWRQYPFRGRDSGRPILQTRTMLDFSWPLLLTAVLARTNAQSETLVLGALTTSDQVGIYFVAFKAISFIAVFLNALDVIFAPMISSLYARGDRGEMDRLYKTVTRWAFTASMPIFLIMFVWSSEVLSLFGDDFVAGSGVLRVLALSQIFWVLSGPCGWMLTMTGHPRFNLLNMLLTLGIALGLDFLLIPRYGAMGAAIGGAVSIVGVNTLRLVEVYVLLHLQPYTWSYLKPFLSGVLAATITSGVSHVIHISTAFSRLLVLCPLLVVSYALLLLALRMETTDLTLVYSLLLRLGVSTNGARRAIGILSFSRTTQEGQLQ
jgi:O-antigen/teichoic acid export membrane protein